jgi:DUF177 domain-containing protein
MLSLNLSRIRVAEEHFEKVYEPAALGEERDSFAIVGPVDLAFDIFKDKDRFRLVGRVRTRLELTCSRCLEPYVMPVDAEFDLRYRPRGENIGDGEREVEEGDLTDAFYENETIDLGQLMHEQFYLALPMKPLCADDCRGLCAQCGTNLNRGACDCPRDWDDPRLAALKTFIDKQEKEHKGH